MSISVKNISLSINGTQSEQFLIEIEGAKYRIDNFTLCQQLLVPNTLSFMLRKDPEEDISEIQFTACSAIIGKDVTLTLQTDAIEQKQSSFNEGGKNADIEFEGFITSADASRYDSEYVIQVEAKSKDAAMLDSPDCHMYNETKLADIVKERMQNCNVKGTVQPKFEDEIFYTVQYNESTYAFLRRLACRYGEWLFSTGKELHFGKLTNQESIQLKYPSLDMPEYSVRLQTCHEMFGQMATLYNDHAKSITFRNDKDDKDTGDKLNDAVAAASKEIYPRLTRKVVSADSIEKDSDAEPETIDEKLHKEEMLAQERMRRSNMLVYHGTTYCSKLKTGMKLTIVDNYISMSAERSEVQQEEILITEITHSFGVDDEYSNSFSGITAKIDYPPYLNPNIYPHCDHVVRAKVVDTEDPKHWGRVKVAFPWQLYENYQGSKNGQTPWIHVAQPYIGNDIKYGTHLIPEVYTSVFVDFEEGNFERPFVRGGHFTTYYQVDEQWYPGDNNVKAIRTASGHTVEIHDTQQGDDEGDKGFIRIYDNKLNVYELLLSTTEQLIKLNCKGDITMHADGNISMSAGGDISATAGGCITNKAGKHMSNSAGGDFNAGAGGNFNGSAGSDVVMDAGNDFTTKASNNLSLTATNEMKIHSAANMDIDSSKEMNVSSEENLSLMTHKSYKLTVEDNAEETINKDLKTTVMNNCELNVTNGVSFKAMTITEEAKTDFKAYAMNYQLSANMSATLQATTNLDLKAMMINEN